MGKIIQPIIEEHVKVCGDKNTFCSHPIVHMGMKNFGNGELVFMHYHTDNVNYTKDNLM